MVLSCILRILPVILLSVIWGCEKANFLGSSDTVNSPKRNSAAGQGAEGSDSQKDGSSPSDGSKLEQSDAELSQSGGGNKDGSDGKGVEKNISAKSLKGKFAGDEENVDSDKDGNYPLETDGSLEGSKGSKISKGIDAEDSELANAESTEHLSNSTEECKEFAQSKLEGYLNNLPGNSFECPKGYEEKERIIIGHSKIADPQYNGGGPKTGGEIKWKQVPYYKLRCCREAN